jgi:hypothetical protein
VSQTKRAAERHLDGLLHSLLQLIGAALACLAGCLQDLRESLHHFLLGLRLTAAQQPFNTLRHILYGASDVPHFQVADTSGDLAEIFADST